MVINPEPDAASWNPSKLLHVRMHMLIRDRAFVAAHDSAGRSLHLGEAVHRVVEENLV